MSLDDLPLIPSEPIPEDADLDAAAQSLLGATGGLSFAERVPEPFGKTPLFDFDTGRMVRAGGRPVYVTGVDALAQWCMMALRTARYAHRVFSAKFGIEEPDSILGEAADVEAEISDWEEKAQRALLVHERITAVENFVVDYDPIEGIVYIRDFDIVTDDEERAEVPGFTLFVGGGF